MAGKSSKGREGSMNDTLSLSKPQKAMARGAGVHDHVIPEDDDEERHGPPDIDISRISVA